MEEKYENSEGSYNYTIINRFGIYDEPNIFSNLLFRINLLIVNFCRWDWVQGDVNLLIVDLNSQSFLFFAK